jgi:hypothetical protein
MNSFGEKCIHMTALASPRLAGSIFLFRVLSVVMTAAKMAHLRLFTLNPEVTQILKVLAPHWTLYPLTSMIIFARQVTELL